MTKNEIETEILSEYNKRFKGWTVDVTDVVLESFGGSLGVVSGHTDTNASVDEICFVYQDGTVRIFESTIELVRFLEGKAKAPFLERLFSRPVFTGMVFSFLLVAIFIIGFQGTNFKPEVLTMLGSVLGGAAGFFFGSSTKLGK